jgi:hypothetical protein
VKERQFETSSIEKYSNGAQMIKDANKWIIPTGSSNTLSHLFHYIIPIGNCDFHETIAVIGGKKPEGNHNERDVPEG